MYIPPSASPKIKTPSRIYAIVCRLSDLVPDVSAVFMSNLSLSTVRTLRDFASCLCAPCHKFVALAVIAVGQGWEGGRRRDFAMEIGHRQPASAAVAGVA
jgi:hypothetical protein